MNILFREISSLCEYEMMVPEFGLKLIWCFEMEQEICAHRVTGTLYKSNINQM